MRTGEIGGARTGSERHGAAPAVRRPGRGAAVWVLAAVALGALSLVLGGAAAREPLVAVLVVGFALACVFPQAVIIGSLVWVTLCRPGLELVHVTVAGNTVTEVDGLVGLSLVASAAWMVRERPASPRPALALAALWPAFLVFRAGLPLLGPHTLLGSTAVDLRILEAYALIVPATVLACRRGWHRLVAVLIGTGVLAAAIALVAWLGFRAGVLAPREWSVVNISASAARDVRPGGELVVCIAVVLVLVGPFVGAGARRLLALALLTAELVVSKTLSLVLAIGAGTTAVLALGWRTLRPALRAAVVAVAVAVLALGLGVVDPGGRYDVRGRIGETSGQYRAAELSVVRETLTSDPLALAVGAGVGTAFTFGDQYVNEVKRDTHSTFLNVLLKTGLLGLVAFLLPFVVIGVRALRRGGQSGRAMAAAMIAVAVLSLTVPFSWTVPGLSALLVLLVAASAASDARVQPAEADAP